MANQPKVAIIVLNWNGIEDTRNCLKSIKNMDYTNYDVVIVDNGSRYNEADFIEKEFDGFLKLIIKNKENLGFAGGNNIAIKKLISEDYDYFLLLNNDAEVSQDTLDKLVGFAEKDKKIGIVGPKIVLFSSPGTIWSAGGEMNWWTSHNARIGKGEKDQPRYNLTKKVDFVPGTCMLIKREVIEEIGLLDGKFFSYREDCDYCLRAKRGGWGIWYLPTTKVLHKISEESEKASAFQIHLITRNRLWLVRKNNDLTKFHLMLFFFIFYKVPIKLFQIIFIRRQGRFFWTYFKGFIEGVRYKKYYLNK